MTKQEYIDYWITTAKDDWEAVEGLFSLKKYVHSLFFAHLTLEKLAKALWVKNNEENIPPKIHNIVYLLDRAYITLTDEQKIFLVKVNDFQLEGRYADYLGNVYSKYDRERTLSVLIDVKEYRLWLLSKLQ